MARSKKVGQFDPSEVSLIVAGAAVTGYADGTYIQVSRRNPAWSGENGADGEFTRIRSVDDSGNIVVTLQMSSSSNDAFSTLAIADENTSKAHFPVIMKDNNGKTVASGAVAFFEKMPDVGYSKGLETREWTILVPHLAYFVGGMADITP